MIAMLVFFRVLKNMREMYRIFKKQLSLTSIFQFKEQYELHYPPDDLQ